MFLYSTVSTLNPIAIGRRWREKYERRELHSPRVPTSSVTTHWELLKPLHRSAVTHTTMGLLVTEDLLIVEPISAYL